MQLSNIENTESTLTVNVSEIAIILVALEYIKAVYANAGNSEYVRKTTLMTEELDRYYV